MSEFAEHAPGFPNLGEPGGFTFSDQNIVRFFMNERFARSTRRSQAWVLARDPGATYY